MQTSKKLGAKQAANALGVSLCTLANWRRKNHGPPYFKVSRQLVMYDEDELRRWLDKKRVDPDEQ